MIRVFSPGFPEHKSGMITTWQWRWMTSSLTEEQRPYYIKGTCKKLNSYHLLSPLKPRYPKSNYSVMNTPSSNFRPLDFVAQSVHCSLDFVVGHCHRQLLLSVECCLGVQNNTWIVKVLKDDYTLTYWFSVLRELLTELNCSCWSICVTSIANRPLSKSQ
jgi:hypothetical protein